jgi:hypothetical protein
VVGACSEWTCENIKQMGPIVDPAGTVSFAFCCLHLFFFFICHEVNDNCQVHVEFQKKLVFIGIIHYLHTNISGP